MKRLLGLATALALTVGCKGGLSLDKGVAYPCQFELGPGARDQACAPGWVCGVTNFCQENKPEGIPSGLAPPTLDGRGLIEPLIPGQVVGVSTSPKSYAALASMQGLGDWVFQYAGTLPFSSQGFTTAGVSETSQGLNFIAMDTSGGISVIRDGGVTFQSTKLPVIDFRAAWDRQGVPESAPVDAIGWAAGVGQRVLPLDQAGVPAAPLTVDGGAVLDLRRIGPGRVGAPSGTLAPVYVVSEPEGVVLASPADWHLLSDPVDPGLPVKLQHSPRGDLWLLAYSSTKDSDHHAWLTGFTVGVSTGFHFVQVMESCIPCPAPMVPVLLAPLSAQPLQAEVLCSKISPFGASLAPKAFQITGANADPLTGACSETPLETPFPLPAVSALDDSVGGFVALGGPVSEIWAGTSLSSALPVLLDQVPNGLGTVLLIDDDFGTRWRDSLAFTDRYFAVDFLDLSRYGVLNAGYTVIGSPSEQPAGAPPPDVHPEASITGTDGWLIAQNGLLAHVELHEHGLNPDGGMGPDAGVGEDVKFGPQLLAPTGAPAQGPYLGQATRDPSTFVLAAADSLYLYPVKQLGDYPGQLAPLTPQLTPQAGFPIRSLTLDGSDGQGAQVHGYAVTSNTLYEFELGGTPEHWSGHQIILSGDEPVKVWMQDARSPYGRVGYRDGTLYTLPDGLPLAPALRQPNGAADRVLDYENFGGWPFALASSGLYIATTASPGGSGSDGGTQLLSWRKVSLPDGGEPWDGFARKMGTLPTADGGVVLRLFGDYGLVYEVGHAAQ